MRAGSTGALSNRLFAAALTTGKRVRTETGIGSSRVSVPSVAVDLALSVLGGLAERHVVILGAGETSELTARALAEQGAGTIFVANRHADRALSLAQRFGGSVVGLDGLPEQLLHADIVLSSTSSPHPIVGREELELVMRQSATGTAAAADRHRGAARHRRRLRRAGGREPVRHRRPAGRRRAQPRHARERGPARAGDRRGGDPALRALARPARGAADGQRAARARQRAGRAGPRRERRALGVGLAARPRARGGDRARGDEPAAARADDPPAQPLGGARPREPRARARAVRPARRRARRARAGPRQQDRIARASSPRSTTSSAAARAEGPSGACPSPVSIGDERTDANRNPRQRARARAGGPCRRAAWRAQPVAVDDERDRAASRSRPAGT